MDEFITDINDHQNANMRKAGYKKSIIAVTSW